MISREVVVELGERRYRVVVGAGLVAGVAAELPVECARVVVVADRAVLPLAGRVAAAVRSSGRTARVVGLRGGERVKTWAQAGRLLQRLAAERLTRRDCVIAVGGGTVGDLAGFAAASYLRGVACIQVPTTLLAMVDSAIGGKTGVNLPQGKNLAGAFWQPRAVLCDLDSLRTLPARAHRAAFAEIIKCSMVADAGLADLIDARGAALLERDPAATAEVVARCCAVKAEVVAGDEREAGRRAILNYGHTVGHALETLTGYGDTLWHGEAVACGMRVAGLLSVRFAGCPESDLHWQERTLKRFGLGAMPPVDGEAVIRRTRSDKKQAGGATRWVLVERLGRGTGGHQLPDEAVRTAVADVGAA